jgi:hypothetical protein
VPSLRKHGIALLLVLVVAAAPVTASTDAPGNACNPKAMDSPFVSVPVGIAQDAHAIGCGATSSDVGGLCAGAPCHETQGWGRLGCVGIHAANLGLLFLPGGEAEFALESGIEETAFRSQLPGGGLSAYEGIGDVDAGVRVDPTARTHILHGDATGGGHMWPGKTGKSAFPESWSEQQIIDSVEHVANNPTVKGLDNRGTTFHGMYQGVDVKVAMRDGRIVTGYPVYWRP